MADDELLLLAQIGRALDCVDVRTCACDKLRARYERSDPPEPKEPTAAARYGPCGSCKTAVQVIALARAQDIPSLIKRAAYELVACPQLWSRIDGGMRAGKLPRVPILKLEDMVRLYAAREWLQRQWRVLVLTPPGRVVDVEGRATVCMCISQKEGREKAEWCIWVQGATRELKWFWIWRMFIEEGAKDPFTGLGLLKKQESVLLQGGWCSRCFRERSEAWKMAKVQWWAELDGRLNLGC